MPQQEQKQTSAVRSAALPDNRPWNFQSGEEDEQKETVEEIRTKAAQAKKAPDPHAAVRTQFHFTIEHKEKAQKHYDKIKKDFSKVQQETLGARSVQLEGRRKYGEKDKKTEDIQEIQEQRKRYDKWKAKFDEAAEQLELAKFEHSRAKRLLDMQAVARAATLPLPPSLSTSQTLSPSPTPSTPSHRLQHSSSSHPAGKSPSPHVRSDAAGKR